MQARRSVTTHTTRQHLQRSSSLHRSHFWSSRRISDHHPETVAPLHRTRAHQMPQPSWELLGLFSAGSAALGAIATASIINALSRRSGSGKDAEREPSAKRQKLSPPSPAKPEEGEEQQQLPSLAAAQRGEDRQEPAQQLQPQQLQQPQEEDAALGTPDAEASGAAAAAGHMPQPDSVVDLQKLQELEQRVADLNALAELGKVYQDSLALSAQLRNLSSFRLQQDKVLGRGSLAVVQEGEYAGDSVAVKLLPIGSVFAEDSRKEACLALCLHHPNIVRVVGVHLVEVEARPFLALVQEAAPGGDLGWQIEDCDFHMGPRGEAALDVSLKLLLDAARGLAYMHDVDVVHGDVKSRNLLVFWEADEEKEEEDGGGGGGGGDAAAAGGGDGGGVGEGPGAEGGEQQQEQQEQPTRRSGSPRPPVWGLKWCDFGVSFRAAEAPGGICKTVTGTPGFRAPEVMDVGWGKSADTYAFGVIAWQLLTGEKPIVYDREWRMHMPNPNLLRVTAGSGPDAIPRTLIELVLDCGAYRAEQRPSMREVVQRLEDIATTRLEAEQAAQAAAAEAQAAAAAAAAAEQEARVQEAQAAEQAATDAAAAEAAAQEQEQAAAAAAAAPFCKLRTGGLARALSQQARDAAAGGAAADMAAAQQQLQHMLQQQQQSADGQQTAAAGAAHRYEVLIENDDDPITAEAVAHTLKQFEASSLSQVLSGHPHALQQVSRAQQAANGSSIGSPVRSLHHSATAPVHSRLLDTAAEAATAAAAAEGTGSRGKGSAAAPSSSAVPINITGAVSRANIELLPATGPGLVSAGTPPLSPTAAAAAAAGGSSGGGAGQPGIGGVGGGSSGLTGSSSLPAAGGSSWFLASGSSFKKGMWLEKTHTGLGAAGAGGSSSPLGAAAAAGAGSSNLRLQSSPGQQQQQQVGSPVPSSPLSLGAAVAVPDVGGGTAGNKGFSLQLRRDSQSQHLPTVAEDELHSQQQLGAAAAAAAGSSGGDQEQAGTAAAVDAAAARALRRSSTTRRLSTDVLAAAGALSKALSAFSSASQALPAVAAAAAPGSPEAAAAAGAGGLAAGGNILLTQDFVAAARGLSEALAALLPSATALAADADPSQGAAAAAAATEAVQGLRSLQGQIASAKAAAAAGTGVAPGSPAAAAAGGGHAGLMGPPRPVNMLGSSAAAAAAAGGGSLHSDSAFASQQQQQFALSPPREGSSGPLRSAALPVPITGPRRSFDGSSRAGPQLSWTSRARAVSSSGAPGGDTPAGNGAAGGSLLQPSSWDSINMSLPPQQQHSPAAEGLLHGLATAAGVLGEVGSAGSGGSWGAEQQPVLLRQPSRRRNSIDGGAGGNARPL